jgi:transcriptional regulator with XRE-family HTH domain
MTLGEKLAALRKERHWSQQKLSEKLGLGGRSANITRWESNRFRPNSTTLQKLADIFEVRIDELLADEAPVPDSLTKDKKLVEKMYQLKELEPEDRAVIFHIIETYAAQRRMAQMATSPKSRLEDLRR